MEPMGIIDRSKVRILLCDNDSSKGDSGDVYSLLCRCSYQVISVKSPRQVIDALNAEGSNIDIILSEVDLPKAKGLKMLKCIMRKELQRIPVIMMSAQDEAPLVVKCLSLGAADYLVKPLRTNELLNLWTHMWRRRRMLGLTEKKMMTCEFDHDDVNTNSTMFSDDDFDEKSIKKSKLNIGQSSAFFTYVNTSKPTRTVPEVIVSVGETTHALHADVDSPPVNLIGQNAHIDKFPNKNSFGLCSAYPYNLYGEMNRAHYPPHHMAGMTSLSYYPSANLCIQPEQSPHRWSDGKGQSQTVDRREAALIKFRQKRKERCFDKKIRYINRKKLAERRPRVRGQFVRKVNGIDVDLNGHPVSTDFDDEDEAA